MSLTQGCVVTHTLALVHRNTCFMGPSEVITRHLPCQWVSAGPSLGREARAKGSPSEQGPARSRPCPPRSTQEPCLCRVCAGGAHLRCC